jgi:hypothetical protein
MSSAAVRYSEHACFARNNHRSASAGDAIARSAVTFPRGSGKKPQYRCGNNSERSFRANEYLFQVVTCIVLAQSSQAAPDSAIRQNNFEAGDEIPCVAVTKDVDAAGIRRDVAADLTTADRAEVEWK